MATFDFSKAKTPTAVKNIVRSEAFAIMLEMFAERFGEDRVSIVGNSTIAVGVTDIKDKDGFMQEICIEVKPVVKDYEDRTTATKKISAYDRLDEAEAYQTQKTEKEKEAEEKAKAKAEKIKRDKKAREKAKAEKEKAKTEKG